MALIWPMHQTVRGCETLVLVLARITKGKRWFSGNNVYQIDTFGNERANSVQAFSIGLNGGVRCVSAIRCGVTPPQVTTTP